MKILAKIIVWLTFINVGLELYFHGASNMPLWLQVEHALFFFILAAVGLNTCWDKSKSSHE
jgi:hypothetical protein